MDTSDPILNRVITIAFPVLSTILAFIGGLAVNYLMKMSDSMNEIRIILQRLSSEHDALKEQTEKDHEHLKERVIRMEKKIFEC